MPILRNLPAKDGNTGKISGNDLIKVIDIE